MKAKKQDMITIHKSLFKDIIFFEKKTGSNIYKTVNQFNRKLNCSL